MNYMYGYINVNLYFGIINVLEVAEHILIDQPKNKGLAKEMSQAVTDADSRHLCSGHCQAQ